MIADTFIKRPVTAIVVSIVIVLVGIISIFLLPISQYPDITPPTVSVSANFTGADAQTVEETTTTPIETQINGTPGMTYMTSNSTGDGSSSISVNYGIGTNVDIASVDVQNRVNVALPTLPDAVKRIGVTVRKRNPDMMMVLAMYSPNGTHDANFLGNFTNIYLEPAILRVPGVGDAKVYGDNFSMRVWLDPNRLAALKMSPSDVTTAISNQNLEVAVGTLGAMPQPKQQAFEYTILTNGRINTVDQFKDIIVRTNPADGSLIRLKDVARVELGKYTYSNNAFVLDGKPSAFFIIYLAPGANALSTYDGIIKELATLKKTFPKDVDYAIPSESATVVKASIHEVLVTFIEALTLVVLVVFLFLQNFRATIIPLLAIPVSLIGTFIFFIPLGFSINTLTLFAFVLAIGIVVDDAIVVVEAVQHYIDSEKISPKDATKKAMNDISGPVVAIALILAAVFVPVSFVPGISGKLYQQFAITIAVSVIISAFIALSLTPALCSLMLRPHKEKSDVKGLAAKFFERFNRWFERVTNSYVKSVTRWIRNTPLVIGMMVVLVVGLIFLFKTKATEFIPQEDEGRLYVTYVMPEGTSTTRSVAMLNRILDSLQTIPAVSVAGGLAGLNIADGSSKSNAGTVFVHLKDWSERTADKDKLNGVIAEINKRTSNIKEASIRAIGPPAINGLGATSGFNLQLEQTSSTDDIQKFEKVAQNFIAEINKRKEIAGAFTYFNPHTPAYQINVNRDKAEKMGVNVGDVYSTMSTLLGSFYVNDFNLYGRNFRVVAMADSSFRSSPSDLNQFYVRNSIGGMVPVGSLVDSVQLVENPSVISHYNIYRSIAITGNAAPGYSSGQAIEALKEVAAKYLPSGYGYEFSGMTREEISAGSSTLYVFIASIVFVFLFLAALYESWSVPFSILFAVPIGLFGAILTLTLIPHLTNNIYAQIGMITIIGLAAKNAILIVEFANEGVHQGRDVIEATLHAVRIRLRPIIMTSLAFILGVMPLAFAEGAASVSRQTIGWTVLGGMLAATSLAIFVVPVWFVFITKLSKRKKIKVDLRD